MSSCRKSLCSSSIKSRGAIGVFLTMVLPPQRSSRQTSSSETKLPDGAVVREHSTRERHRDGRSVLTTTRTRTGSAVRWLRDGSSVLENVTETTTTRTERVPRSDPAGCAGACAGALAGCHADAFPADGDGAGGVGWDLDSAESGPDASGAAGGGPGSPEEAQRTRTDQARQPDKGPSQISFFHKTHPSSRRQQADARDDEVESDLRRRDRAGDDQASSQSSGSRSAASPRTGNDGSDSSHSGSVSSGLSRSKTRPRSVTPSQRLSQRQVNRHRYLISPKGGDDGEVRQALEYMGKVRSYRAQPACIVEPSAGQTSDAETHNVPSTPAAAIINGVSLADCLHDETRKGGKKFHWRRPLLPARPAESLNCLASLASRPLVPEHRGQALLDGLAPPSSTPPKVAIHGADAVVVASNRLHFYSLVSSAGAMLWRASTTVNLSSTRDVSIALHSNVAVVGLPHDLDRRRVPTGAAYIFEKDGAGSETEPAGWSQVKKVVPRNAQEHATAGYSVDACDGVVAVGVPDMGGRSKGGGAVYTYARVDKFVWSPIGVTRPELRPNAEVDPATGLGLSNFGSRVALRNNTLVVSDYSPNSRDESLLCSISVYEYTGERWTLIQADLLSTEGRRKFFGSSIRLADDGTNLLVGSTPDTSPSEILYFRRDGLGREFELHSVVAPIEPRGVASFAVHGDHLALGTVGEQVNVYKIDAADGRWAPILKVEDPRVAGFGQCLALHGDRMLVGSNGNVHSHSLERWVKDQLRSDRKRGSRNKRATGLGFGISPLRSRQRDELAPRKRLLSSLSPLRRR